MLIQETWINATKGHQIGESDKYEPFTDDLGKLFRSLQREYGRCVSAVYVDEGGKVKRIGWTFIKRHVYEDARDVKRDTYLAETWITLYEAPDDVVRTVHYKEI